MSYASSNRFKRSIKTLKQHLDTMTSDKTINTAIEELTDILMPAKVAQSSPKHQKEKCKRTEKNSTLILNAIQKGKNYKD